jgi:hypothetical protein
MFFVFKSGSPNEGACSGGLGDCTDAFLLIENAKNSVSGLSDYDLEEVEILDGSTGVVYTVDRDGQWVSRTVAGA